MHRNDPFTKTGSGQTYVEKTQKGGALCRCGHGDDERHGKANGLYPGRGGHCSATRIRWLQLGAQK